MSILKDIEYEGGYRVQLVDGQDIIDTYLNNKKVNSCMGKKRMAPRLQFYTFCEGLKLLRIIKDDVVYLRSLIWRTHELQNRKNILRYADTVYCRKYTAYEDIIHTDAYEIFKQIWQKFADVRDSNKNLEVNVQKNSLKKYPYVDTFLYMNSAKNRLYNKLIPSAEYQLHDAEYGNLSSARYVYEYWGY